MPDHGQLVSFGVASCLLLALMVALRNGLDVLVRIDATVRNVNPNQPADSAELVAFDKILERRGWRGVRMAILVGMAVCASMLALNRSWIPDGTTYHERIEGDDVAIMYGLMAGCVFYVVRLALCRCPRCGRRLIGLWTLLWLSGHIRFGAVIERRESIIVTRCPHCETPFGWTA